MKTARHFSFRFIAILLACMALAPAFIHATAPNAARAGLYPLPEDIFLETFLKSCYANAGDSAALQEWAAANMKPAPATDKDKKIQNFIGRWEMKAQGRDVEMRLIDDAWRCDFFSRGMNSASLVYKMSRLKKKIQRNPRNKVRTSSQTPSNQKENIRLVMRVEREDDEELTIALTFRASHSGPVQLSLSYGESDRREDEGKTAAATAAQDQSPSDDTDDTKDEDPLTVQAVELFAEGCLAHFGDMQAIHGWADENLAPHPGSGLDSIDVQGLSVIGNWARQFTPEAWADLTLIESPAQCLVTAAITVENTTHNQMRLLAQKITDAGKYTATYTAHNADADSTTRYSIIDMTPVDGNGPALQIVASTNTQLNEASVFTLGYKQPE